ncbi:MAG TPA: gamma-glutamyltransferase [Steroidobacteraceae bacterium]|nr:gamma-glutamyltransferase [Steroidobacteraceae bacterium]
MPLLADSFSSPVRPVLEGRLGAISAAHPLAVAAGQEMLVAGGSAVDALIAAQAVLCVVAPDACGLGGDVLALVHEHGHDCVAVNGAGAAPFAMRVASADGADSITVPGIVDGWGQLNSRWGRLPLATALAPALRIARDGFPLPAPLAITVATHRARLLRGGAGAWPLLSLAAGERFVQPALAHLLGEIGDRGADGFYRGSAAAALVAAVRAGGGSLAHEDLAAHATDIRAPLTVRFGNVRVAVQPPMAQGVLLAMALQGLAKPRDLGDVPIDHVGIELTEAAFEYRSRVGEGAALLTHDLSVNLERAGRKGGPRAYLHTAGVATADAQGMVASSLVSVFDDFGSCVFVPELGITLNNRAGGFTDGANSAAPGKRPVHTLAPALVTGRHGTVALATPGADGQVQTLLQIIERVFRRNEDLATAIAAPRWRSEGGALLIEQGHAAAERLATLGHQLQVLKPGDVRFGAVVCAGTIDGVPIAVSDWRRHTWSGVT